MTDKLISGGITTGTGATGLVGMTAMIPDGIAKVACLVGIFGTFVVIIATIVKSRFDAKISELTIQKLKLEISKDETK